MVGPYHVEARGGRGGFGIEGPSSSTSCVFFKGVVRYIYLCVFMSTKNMIGGWGID